MSNLPPFTLPGSTPEPTGPEATEPVAPPVDESNPVVDSEEAVFAAAVEAALGRRVDSGSDPSATGIPAPEAGEGGVGGEPVEGLAPADSATDDGTNPLIPTGGPITDGVDDGSGSASTPTIPDPTADLIDLGDGRVASLAELADLYAWANSLTPAQQQRIIQATSVPDPLYPQSAASGSGTPAPVLPASSVPGVGSPASYPPAGYPAAGQPGVPVTPESNRLDARTALGEMADLVPGLATYLEQVQADQAQLNAELASYRQQQALRIKRRAEAKQSRTKIETERGHEAFVPPHPSLKPPTSTTFSPRLFRPALLRRSWRSTATIPRPLIRPLSKRSCGQPRSTGIRSFSSRPVLPLHSRPKCPNAEITPLPLLGLAVRCPEERRPLLRRQ